MKYLLLLLCLIMATPAQAGPRVRLFDNFYLDMPRSKVQRKAEAQPCSTPGLEEHLCRPEAVEYATLSWRQVFMFAADRQDRSADKLKMVVLQRPFSPQDFRKTVQEVLGGGFVLAEITADGASFDSLAEARKGKNNFQSSLEIFERKAANSRQLTYSFLDKRSMRAAQKNASLREFLRQAPANTRGITLSHNGRLMLLTFLAPGAQGR